MACRYFLSPLLDIRKCIIKVLISFTEYKTWIYTYKMVNENAGKLCIYAQNLAKKYLSKSAIIERILLLA